MTERPYFSWASGAAPYVGGLVGLIPMMGQIPSDRRSAWSWWLWLIGILLNAYPFMFFLLGVSVQLGITRIHL